MRVIESDAFSSFHAITQKLAKAGFQQKLDDLEVQKKLLNFFQVGDYYYYVYNLQTGVFDFMSPEIKHVLGHDPNQISVSVLVNSIHPEDVPWFLNFENKVSEFFSALNPDQVLKYKVRYDYRLRKTTGEYVRILQQVITLHYDTASHSLLRTFGVHTDITHLKKEGKPVLSFIGMDGEPSYIDIAVDEVFAPSLPIISEREKEVVRLLIEGNSSKVIGNRLGISHETVNKHRKNILRKTNTTSTSELIAKAIRGGWI